MNKDQLKRETLYQATMEIMKRMLNEGLIVAEEYAEIDARMSRKYHPVFGTLLYGIDLI